MIDVEIEAVVYILIYLYKYIANNQKGINIFTLIKLRMNLLYRKYKYGEILTINYKLIV